MFHRINESMVLGMHPAISCPRRSQFRPPRVSRRPRWTLLQRASTILQESVGSQPDEAFDVPRPSPSPESRASSLEPRAYDVGSFFRVFDIPPIRPNQMRTSAPAMIHT